MKMNQKRILSGISLVLLGVLVISGVDIKFLNEAKTYDGFYVVNRVIDGDTFKIILQGKEESVRLVGIDAPELGQSNKTRECFAEESFEKARSVLEGDSIRIEQDPSQDVKDKYGRILAYVFLKDGTNFNQLMIKQGLAHEYTYYGSAIPYKYQQEFKLAEREAKANGLGLWGKADCES